MKSSFLHDAVVGLLTGLALGGFLVLLTVTLTHAHSWYPSQCCNGSEVGGDCHPIDSCEELTETKDGGYDWNEFHFRKDQVHPSQDSKCHVCVGHYNFGGQHSTPHCVFIQQGV